MNYFVEGIVWLNDPLNWTNPGGLMDRLQEHLVISFWAVLKANAVVCIVNSTSRSGRRKATTTTLVHGRIAAHYRVNLNLAFDSLAAGEFSRGLNGF